VEWNLLSSREAEPEAHAQVGSEFESLWEVASTLTPELVENYSRLAAKYRTAHFEPESSDYRELPLIPRPWQEEALVALENLRAGGYKRALVAVATGMGKTWLAAFDVRQVGDALQRRPRVLVIAHRAHILAQAEAAISLVLDARYSVGTTAWYIGTRNRLDGDVVIASVQKLSRPEGLLRIAQEQFDYVVVDEVHHAHAPSYRRVLSQLQGDFMLGLTATPERTDGFDVAAIFDDNLAYHATIGDGIAEDSLVPFHYIGIKDTVDFRQIPWRNGRFDLAELEQRVDKSERMDRLWTALQSHPAERTLVFCCSRRHALFARDWLRKAGMTAAAVFSGGGGDSYGEALAGLRCGKLQFLCAVDMFNEGLDIPAVDRVVMLRPTESKIVFLQQLGRGLRASEGKSRLLVIDFVGNHRIFAQRIVHLLSLRSSQDGWQTLKDWLNGVPPSLPEGCLLDVELDAQDMLKEFLPKGKVAAVEGYRGIRDELGRRPTMLEVFTRGFLPRAISSGEGSWFPFAATEGNLTPGEQAVVDKFSDWLKMLETTSLNKSYKMIVLRVLLDQGKLFEGAALPEFAKSCRSYLQNHQILRRDLEGDNHAIDHVHVEDEAWANWWIKWPIGRWLDGQKGTTWFIREGNQFKLNLACPRAMKPAFELMTEEIVDWRLAAYAKSRRLVQAETGEAVFTAKVSHSQGRPILFLPDKAKAPGRPVGVTQVRLPEGALWEFKFVKVACNVAKPPGETANHLGSLLQQWFGPNAGLPGTTFSVQFATRNGVWHATPEAIADRPTVETTPPDDVSTVEIKDGVPSKDQYTTHVPVYDLFVAAGVWGSESSPTVVGWIPAPNHRLKAGMFAARVTGHSMEPQIPSGSWCLFRPCPAGSREGKLLLVQVNTHLDPEDGDRYMVNRFIRLKRRWGCKKRTCGLYL
jgi:superfamily II DNA or RNA helicase